MPPKIARMPFSVYVHVPFCRTRCHYCAFYSGEPLEAAAEYPSWVAAEVLCRAQRAPTPSPAISTVYLGGGTPSLLGASRVAAILETIHRTWGLLSEAEVTIEVNPATDLDFSGLRTAGITRLSLGVQCLDDALLSLLGRPHTAHRALSALEAAARSGSESVSVDLLLGLPGARPDALARWVRTVTDAGARHVSAYSLEVHPGTALARAADGGSVALPSPDEEEEQWEAVDEALASCGHGAYEVSNYCAPGHECRHNLAYWDRSPYVGLGPGAHSFDPAAGAWGRRSWNDADLAAYSRHLTAGGLPPGGSEHLTAPESLLECLFLALRRPVPVDLDHLAARHHRPPEIITSRIRQAAAAGLLRADGSSGHRRWRPTREGLRRADGLALWLSEGFPAPPT
ncbi:MAG: radical SAM family heme chaperone HemW [Deltaproteobacteria bacterium]|nr:radical SAM family heme chaperone HemW [Deltaproteobacteria bacterium]